jgi:hypothetical protein
VSPSPNEILSDTLKYVQTRPLFVLREQVPPVLVIGQTPTISAAKSLKTLRPEGDGFLFFAVCPVSEPTTAAYGCASPKRARYVPFRQLC